ncbi:nucleotide-diphospho-sugar transferase [uncultured Maribacter sp.]|uniref:nucleotide-diphospho-sugar transferase n=1 Tax=uncultured Maribacter sp. TaxID=431308 RepID=UPI002637DFD8|nr:nucleotide-diphospho-sugar transferase [uncultured Maribacter sp.]
MEYLEIPILFVVFNRKKTSLLSLEAIKKVKPKRIFIAGDGPRKHILGEIEKVNETRSAVLKAIDWDCEIKTLFQEDNLGCGPGVYTAINWFFNEVEMGIILEDDCVAQPSFFNFSEELLKKYKNDERIALISGFNQVGSSMNDLSYCFSKYVVCWGWATWKRAWDNMDYDMSWKGGNDEVSILSNCGFLGKDYKYWKRRVKAIDNNIVSAWDFQWCYSVGAQNQLGVFPSHNLISNIGFDEDATHTSKSPFVDYESNSEVEFPLKHPNFVVPNFNFDKAFYKDRNSLVNTIAWFFPKPIKDFVKKIMAIVYSK